MITIIVPVHNTEKYLDKCLNSIKKQTYKNIEVLCIDSSNDSSTDIIKKYVSADKRFKLIQNKNTSYGYKINLGIKLAKGSYIGIVDADDYITSKMYENAIKAIKNYKTDFVKFDYDCIYQSPSIKKVHMKCGIDNDFYKNNFDSFKKPNIFYDSNIAIWSALYRKKFLIDNKIKLNESPGACFQDTGFFILTHLYAKRIRYLKGSYYKYRRNNDDSSSNATNNVFSIIYEFEYIFNKVKKYKFLNTEQLDAIVCRKYFTYAWNFIRLENNLAEKFRKKISKEFTKIYKSDKYKHFPSRIKTYIENSEIINQ